MMAVTPHHIMLQVKGTTRDTRSCGSVGHFQREPAEEGDEVPLDGKERQ